MKLFIASDHAGYELKAEMMKSEPVREGSEPMPAVEWIDLGPSDAASVDYPNFAAQLSQKILSERSRDERLQPCGVLICGSGVGMSIAANRFDGIRAVLAQSAQVAKLSREHNASNVLCLGARLTPAKEAREILKTWLNTKFEGGRHERRVDLMDQLTKGKG